MAAGALRRLQRHRAKGAERRPREGGAAAQSREEGAAAPLNLHQHHGRQVDGFFIGWWQGDAPSGVMSDMQAEGHRRHCRQRQESSKSISG